MAQNSTTQLTRVNRIAADSFRGCGKNLGGPEIEQPVRYRITPFRGGYIGYFRRVHKATNEILKDDNGAEIIFPSQAEAEAAAGKALAKYLNGDLCCSGIIPSIRGVRKNTADKLFNIKEGARA